MISHLRLSWRAQAVSAFLFCLVFSAILPAFGQATWTWTGDDGADWYDPLNWSPNGTPATNDIEYIYGGTVYLSQPVIIAGQLNWSGGIFTGNPLEIATNGVVNINGDVEFGNVMTNSGTVYWYSGTVQLDDQYGDYPNVGPIVNATNGVWNIQGNDTMQVTYSSESPNAVFQNNGTVIKTTGSGTTYYFLPFENYGVLEATNNVAIDLGSGGFLGGVFEADTGSAIYFSQGNFQMVNSSPITTGGGTAIFSTPYVYLSFTEPITNFLFSQGYMVGSNAVSGTMTWAGGVMSGSLDVLTNGILDINGGSSTMDVDSTLLNYGTVNWQGGTIQIDTCSISTAGPIVNEPGGAWNIQCDQVFKASCSGGSISNAYFQNAGLLTKTITGGVSYFFLPVNNTGSMNISGGTMGLYSGGTMSGAINALGGANVDFEAGTFGFVSSLPQNSGAGQVQLNSGAYFTFSAPITNFDMFTGTMLGNATLSGTMNWTGGTIQGTLGVETNAILDIDGNSGTSYGTGVILAGAITNGGTVDWFGGNIYIDTCVYGNVGPIVNLPGAMWSVQCDEAIKSTCTGSQYSNSFFQNQGAVLKTSNGGETYFQLAFLNSGSVGVTDGVIGLENGGNLGGTFQAAASTAINFDAGSFELANSSPAGSGAGLVQFTSGAYISFSEPITNFDMPLGTLFGNTVVTGVMNCYGGTIAGPLTIASNATLNFNASSVTIDSSVTNYGTLNWLNGSLVLDTCNAANAGPIVNESNALWNIQCDQNLSASCSGFPNAFVQNAGTVVKSITTNETAFVLVPFNNTGTVIVETGSIGLEQGGILYGLFTAQTNTGIHFDNGGFAMINSSPSTSGGGAVTFGTGASMSFSEPITNFNMTEGTLTGNNVLTGAMTCSGGLITGSLTISNGASLDLNGSLVDFDCALTNYGTMNWLSGNLYMDTDNYGNASGPIVIQPGGTWNIACDQVINSGNYFNNTYIQSAGIVRKTGNTGTTTVWVPFRNSGRAECDLGTLYFAGGEGSGSYTETASATLAIGIGGANANSQYGQLQMYWPPTFVGTFAAFTENGFTPTTGEGFAAILYPSCSGAFSATNTVLDDGFDLTAFSNGSTYILVAQVDTNYVANPPNTNPPPLTIMSAGPNVLIQWPTNYPGWVLQAATNFPMPNWTNVPGISTNQALLPASATQQYFRLMNGN